MSAKDTSKLSNAIRELLDCEEDQQLQRIAEIRAVDPELANAIDQRLNELQEDDNFLRPLGEQPNDSRHFGEFELIRELGRGGSGVVWLARQSDLDRDVAIKMLQATPATPERLADRFEREAKSIARLNHPGIVGVHMIGRRDNISYLAMDYVPGADLGVILRRQRLQQATAGIPKQGERGRVTRIASLCIEMADALQHAHDHGVVHRDIKPQNLLLREDGKIVVVDFGLARTEDLGNITKTGEFAGTLSYMSPEQLARVSSTVDHRTDVFSLGVVLYEMLTLAQPFEGSTSDQVVTHIQEAQPRPIRQHDANVPKDLETICMKALEKLPDDRYPSASALAEDLHRFLDREPITARPIALPRRVFRFARRRRWALLTLAASLITATLAGVATLAEANQRARAERLAPIRLLTELADWAKVPTDQLMAAREALRNHRSAAIAEIGAAGIELFEKRMEQLASARHGVAMSAIRQELRNSNAGDTLRVDGRSLMRGAAELIELAMLFPEKLYLEDDTALLPTISVHVTAVDGSQLSGTVSRVELDPITGVAHPSKFLGHLPLRATRIAPGFCRFRMETLDYGVQEFTRLVTLQSEDLVFEYQAKPDFTSAGKMVFVPGASIPFPSEGGSMTPLRGQTISVPPFWIDRYEVSNREYARFLAATTRSAPIYWHLIRSDADTDTVRDDCADQPVTMISWDDARAYAEWAGKRLPSYVEWQLAARSPAAWRFPWADSGNYRGNTTRALVVAPPRDQQFANYLKFANPVASNPEACTPSGIHHLLGNASEWLESLPAFRRGSEWEPSLGRRIIAGSWWCASALGDELGNHSIGGSEPEYVLPHVGFRCVRSHSL